MSNKFLKYGAGLIAVYLLVAYNNTTSLIVNGTKGAATVVKSFQGRN